MQKQIHDMRKSFEKRNARMNYCKEQQSSNFSCFFFTCFSKQFSMEKECVLKQIHNHNCYFTNYCYKITITVIKSIQKYMSTNILFTFHS